MKWLFGIWLGVVLLFRRIDIDSELLMAMWQKQAAIEIYDPSPALRRAHLSARLDATFPF